ncbi:MAG: glycosyltransferase [Bryobacteraceae bacterium]
MASADDFAAERDRLRRENERLIDENRRIEWELREAREQVADLRNSLSWRITAPLRKGLDLVQGKTGHALPSALESADDYSRWLNLYARVTPEDRRAIHAATERLAWKPAFLLRLRVVDPEREWLEATLASVRRQVYRAWELHVIDAGSQQPWVARLLADAATDPRIRVERTSGDATFASTAEFAADIEPGDCLEETALFEIAAECNASPDVTVIYTDEDSIDLSGRRSNPRFKPAWNPTLHHAQEYFGKLVFRRTGASDPVGCVRHVPAVLSHVRHDRHPPPARRTHTALAGPKRSVTAIIPVRDRGDLLESCLAGLFDQTAWNAPLDIVIVNNESSDPRTMAVFEKYRANGHVRVLDYPGAFNWSAMNNAAAAMVTSKVLLFLNNDVEMIESEWLEQLTAPLAEEQVAATGAKLLFADGTVQHAGILLGAAMGPRHLLRLSARDDPGYLGRLALPHDVEAVTGACMAVRRDAFQKVGGFDEAFPVSFNDVDFCFRAIDAGYRIVWTPDSVVRHLESASRGSGILRTDREEADHRRFVERWEARFASYHWLNPNLALTPQDRFCLACPPRRKRPWER